MAYISQVVVTGTARDVKDIILSGEMHYVGTTTSIIADGSSVKPIIVDGQSYTQELGDVVLYDSKEYIWNGKKWVLIGGEGSIDVVGTLDTSVETMAGEIEPLTFTGVTATLEGTVVYQPTIAVQDGETYTELTPVIFETTVTPSGSISTPTFNETKDTVTLSVTGVPNGSVDAPSFSGETATITATSLYQPSGTVSKPNITLTLATDTFIKSITQSQSTTGPIATVDGEVLILGNAITSVGAVSVSSSGNAVVSSGTFASLVSAPTFTGETATITITTEYKPSGTISTPTFHGETSTFTVSTNAFLTSGSVSTPSFSGEAMTINIAKRLIGLMGEQMIAVSIDYQPEGTISTPVVHSSSHKHSIINTTRVCSEFMPD